jgi:AAA family ATP:ADP antiporter
MTGPFSVIRPGEYRETAAASFTVMLVMAAHASLETARDTLFLSNVPATRLPWVYLAIAALAVLGGPMLSRSGGGANRRSLIALQLSAAAGTAVFLALVRLPHVAVYYALYLWGGIAGAVVLVRFWLILTDRFATGQAKRLFPIIAAGAVVGSLQGYGIAALVAWWHQPRALLLASATLFAASAGASLLWWRVARPHTTAEERTSGGDGGERTWRGIRDAIGHSYVQRITLMLLLASMSVTV